MLRLALQELHDLVERLKTENQQLVKEQQLQAQQHEEMKRIPGNWKGSEDKLRYEQIPGVVLIARFKCIHTKYYKI